MRKFTKIIGYTAAILIILTASFISVVRYTTPLLNDYRGEFEKYASQLLQTPVTIKKVRISWEQYQPVIGLSQVVLLDKVTKQPVMRIKKVNVLFSIPKSILQHKLITNGLMLSGAKVSIEESSQGELKVKELSSLALASSSNQEMKFTDVIGWLSQEPRLILRDIDIHYTGYKQPSRFVTLYNLSFDNTTDEHQIVGKAILHQDLPTEVALAAKWQGKTFDLQQIKAHAYVYVSGLSLPQWLKQRSWNNWQVKEGLVSAKVWLDWKEGGLRKIQSNLQLYGLNLYSEQEKTSRIINRLSGNFGWKHDGQDYIIAGDEVLLDLPEHLWPVTSFYLNLANESGKLSPTTMNIGYIDVGDVQSYLLSAKNLLPKNVVETLSHVKLQGGLQQSHIGFANVWDDWLHATISARFNKLGFNAGQNYPSMKNLTGELTWDGKQGELNLESSRTIFSSPKIFANDIYADQLSGSVSIERNQENAWVLRTSSLQFMNTDMAANINGSVTIPSKTSPVFDMTANFTMQHAKHVANYLPQKIFGDDLSTWLKQAFLTGEIESGHAILRGAINDYPFDKSNGELTIATKLKHINFRFAPDWPILENLSGELNFLNRKMEVKVDEAETLGIKLKDVSGVIPYIGDDKPSILEVNSSVIPTDFTQGFHYVKNSPLEKTLGKMFKDVNLSGPIELNLSLRVPLSNPDNTSVKGDILMQDAVLKLPAWDLALKKLTGRLKFTESTTEASGLQAELFNKPFQFDLGMKQKSKTTSVVEAKFNHRFDIADVQNWLKLPFDNLVKGSALIDGKVEMSLTEPLAIYLRSNLQGASINLADEYGKKADDSRDFSTDIFIQNDQPLKIKLSYGDLFNAAALLTSKQGKYDIIAANLGFGTSASDWPTSPGLAISGQFDKLDSDKIKSYLSNSSASTTTLPPIKTIALRVNHFTFGGLALNGVQLQAIPDKKNWEVKLISDEMVGRLLVPLTINRSSTIIGQFNKINIHSTTTDNALPVLDVNTLPAISLVANDVTVNDMTLGRIVFNAVPSKNGLHIQSLRIASPRIDLRSVGDWSQANGGYVTHLEGGATTTNVSGLLSSLRLPLKNFEASYGSLNFNLDWDDAPYSPAIAKLNGRASMSLGKGRIVDIGKENAAKMDLGRMLSIFSLQSIPRRLSLDFSDVFEKGYSFDSVKSDFSIKQGDIFTKKLVFDGPVASITINGRIGLNHKDYEFILGITPHDMTSSLPVAATILINPLVGLGALAVNQVIGSQMSKAAASYYEVIGPWNNPRWKPVSR